jgi:hypothetical protein
MAARKSPKRSQQGFYHGSRAPWDEVTEQETETTFWESQNAIDLASWQKTYPWLTEEMVNEAVRYLHAHVVDAPGGDINLIIQTAEFLRRKNEPPTINEWS